MKLQKYFKDIFNSKTKTEQEQQKIKIEDKFLARKFSEGLTSVDLEILSQKRASNDIDKKLVKNCSSLSDRSMAGLEKIEQIGGYGRLKVLNHGSCQDWFDGRLW